MKNQLINSTPFMWRCRKAALLLLATGGAALCAFFSPATAQSVQSMVRNMPFPYSTGMAMDSALYAGVKAKLQAAEQLRTSARRAVDSLQKEILVTRQAMDAKSDLLRYDKKTIDSLSTSMESLQSQLRTAQSSLKSANAVFDRLLAELPRRTRRSLASASPEQLADAVIDYVHLLQARKWKWAGASALVSGTLTVFALLLR